ncbi:hypothetical protein ANCCAN_20863 [Ancylostoma caninum]|uniref:Geminin n=1 Tax=Ancylostoma caninum TaxID=29170 RepID=A0A368FMM6_ANCCA|nr:hypothetical protein ANCCAN_20863 [Ancylostoma caninum]
MQGGENCGDKRKALCSSCLRTFQYLEKSDAKKRLVPVTPSSCDKENRETQAKVASESSFTQTDVLALREDPSITKEDLLSDEPSSSYWRGMAEKFENEIDKELENSFNASLELDKSYEELEDSKNRLNVIMEVLDELLNGGEEVVEEVNNSPDKE